jgi:hypothetical protein
MLRMNTRYVLDQVATITKHGNVTDGDVAAPGIIAQETGNFISHGLCYIHRISNTLPHSPPPPPLACFIDARAMCRRGRSFLIGCGPTLCFVSRMPLQRSCLTSWQSAGVPGERPLHRASAVVRQGGQKSPRLASNPTRSQWLPPGMATHCPEQSGAGRWCPDW